MATYGWLDVLGFGRLQARGGRASRWSHTGRAPKTRALAMEPLEDRTLLSAGGRPTPPGVQGQNVALGCYISSTPMH
jgi:hypothetical protein